MPIFGFLSLDGASVYDRPCCFLLTFSLWLTASRRIAPCAPIAGPKLDAVFCDPLSYVALMAPFD